MPREEYMEAQFSSGLAWVLSSRISDLQSIDAIFFDCDGVLVDVRDSYDATIVETVKFLAKGLMGLDIPTSLPLHRSILELKRSGGFNNDWHVSYALLLGIYTYLPREQGTLSADMISDDRERILLERTTGRKSPASSNRSIPESSWKRVGETMIDLGRSADSTGLPSVERILINEGYGQALDAAKRLLGYPVEASIVGRVFDEIFYGPQLFRQKFKVEAKFYTGRGLVERETPAIAQETLNRLKATVGRGRIGIISGRDYASAGRTLGALINNFESENLLFLMVDPNHGAKEGRSAESFLNKPNPGILLKAVRSFGPFQRCLYVGDSAEDLIMVQLANKILHRFAFAGVYGLANFKDEICYYFREKRADVILPSVNELPELLDFLKGWKQ